MSEENRVVGEAIDQDKALVELTSKLGDSLRENQRLEKAFDNLALRYDQSQDVLRMIEVILKKTDNEWRHAWTHAERGTISKLCLVLIGEAIPGRDLVLEPGELPF